MFEEFHRVLKPGGLVIISSPDKYHYSDKTNFKNPFHIKELYQKEFKEIMAREFKFTFHLNQNIYYNSIIAPDSENTSRFTEYQGSFDRLEKFSTLSIPMYNICIGSNNELDLREMALISTFNSPMLLNDLKNKEQEIYNSKTYRLGKSLTIPYRLLLRLFNK
jgi:SAM-dependent methyltransferase